MTPLHHVASEKKRAAAENLVDEGADGNAKDIVRARLIS
jgi:hypothetical protein